MVDKPEALEVLLVLLPGFACAYIVQLLAVRRRQTELDKVVEALLFSLLLYLVTLPFFDNRFPLEWQNSTQTAAGVFQFTVHWKHLAVLAALALLTGILYAALINRDWLLLPFRKFKITERTARSSVWNDVFQETGGYVQVGLADRKKLMGWLRYYSDDPNEASLFLEKASWITMDRDGKASEVPIDGPGILITRQMKIEYVIFLSWDSGGTPPSAMPEKPAESSPGRQSPLQPS